MNLVVLTALIVLVPGMMLTTAVRELSAQHLASGVSRLFGAFAVMLKLIFGVVAVNVASALVRCEAAGARTWSPMHRPGCSGRRLCWDVRVSPWYFWPSVATGCWSPLSAMLGYLVAR